MPLYDYCCPQGHVFEQMATIAARAQQVCPACGQVSDKIPSRVTLGGRADPGPSKEQMPQTWRGTHEGNPEYLGQLRRQWSARQKLEEKYPELRGDQRPVLAYRFEPSVMVETIRDERPTFTIGSITVFIALMNAPNADRDALASLTKTWSGGAPIPPSTVKAFQAQFGQYIHNAYGLTETTSPSHLVPFDAVAPVDDISGALSVGVPVYNTVVRIVGDDGQDLPPGEVGEIVTSGPMVVSGYWNKPEETEHALPGGALHTGDVGYMDAVGWFYIVDRKKDQINAGGYKVWPREVEDVLYQHEAVREAAVVGVPDAYRGETVKAYVSLRPGQAATAEELIAFCREQMAAYKYPRQVEFLDELPKTVSGKLLRRELRDRG